jgi:hypothetical protein
LIDFDILPKSKSTDLIQGDVQHAVVASTKELEALIQSIDSLVERPSSDRVKLVMYVDETGSLTKVKLKDRSLEDGSLEDHLYDAFCHCISRLSSTSFVCIFLSTASEVETLAPSQDKARSARLHIDASGLQAPFTETPFDCGPDLPVLTHHVTLLECNTLKFMAQFGRPL